MNNYITPGELAKLAGTTKRTVLWYDQKGVLRPKVVDEKGNRLYVQEQILDYQRIFLLTNLGVSLKEIKDFLANKGDLEGLFEEKRLYLTNEIAKLNFNLKNLNTYTQNIKDNGTMINPKIVTLKPMDIYYVEKICSYSQINSYCTELMEMFAKKGRNFTTMSIFLEPGYKPLNSKILVCALDTGDMEVKRKYQKVVMRRQFNPGKVITYTHKGSFGLLSLFWKELEKYCELKHITPRTDESDFEIYRRVNVDETRCVGEIYLPVK